MAANEAEVFDLFRQAFPGLTVEAAEPESSNGSLTPEPEGPAKIPGKVLGATVGPLIEVLEAAKVLVAYMGEHEPERFKRRGWKRLADAVSTAEGSVGTLAEAIQAAATSRGDDPRTSAAAADIASISAGSIRHRLGWIYHAHPEGLTADEAVTIAGLGESGSPYRRVYDLRGMGLLSPTGETRTTRAGAPAEVLAMPEGARRRWSENFPEGPPESG